MPASITVRGAPSVARVQQTLAGRGAGMVLRNRLAMEQVTLRLERTLKVDHLTGQAGEHPLFGKTGAKGNALAVVTGHTRNTIVRAVFTRAKHVQGVVGSPLKSFAVHEYGATVRGKPYLRIPTRFAKTASGQDRLGPRSARTLGNTFIARTKAGNLFIFERGTPRAEASPRGILPLYLLKPTVKLRARHMLRETLKANITYIREQFRGVTAYVAKGR